MKCRFYHHEEFEQEIYCPNCGGPWTCGPFMHACPVCDPEEFKPCENCGALVVECCC